MILHVSSLMQKRIYTYEGTHEINALVIGRALTGDSAFVINSKELYVMR